MCLKPSLEVMVYYRPSSEIQYGFHEGHKKPGTKNKALGQYFEMGIIIFVY